MGHVGTTSGSKMCQNKTKKFIFFALVGREVVFCRLHKGFRLFCMAQCGSRGCVYLILPIFVDQHFGIGLSLHRDSINYHKGLSLSKSVISIVFGVPFHYIGLCKFPKTLEMGNMRDSNAHMGGWWGESVGIQRRRLRRPFGPILSATCASLVSMLLLVSPTT